MLGSRDSREMIDLFGVQASGYWDTHFLFGKLSMTKPKFLGIDSIRLLTVNLVVPFLFLYGETKSIPSYKEKGLSFLENLPPENNVVINHWMETGYLLPECNVYTGSPSA